jgi:hypothetical protein
MAEINSGTGAGLREFLDRAAGNGDLNPSTANALRAAVTSVLSVEDDPDQVDVRHLDVDTTLQRFETLHRSRYTPASMKSYQSRFRNAVAMYIAWLDKDPNWRKVVKARRAVAANGRPSKPGAMAPELVHVQDTDFGVFDETAAVRLVTYHLPLRPDLIVQLQLPVDLTPDDAARVAAFVKSLVFEAPTTSPHEHAGDK